MNDHVQRRQNPRIPFETEIEISFADVGELIDAYSANMSIDGMFVATEQPLPRGTLFDFRFRAGGDQTFISGRAEVVWTRDHAASPMLPAGMGVRFASLDDVSKAIIFRIVDHHIQEGGGEPFELTDTPRVKL